MHRQQLAPLLLFNLGVDRPLAAPYVRPVPLVSGIPSSPSRLRRHVRADCNTHSQNMKLPITMKQRHPKEKMSMMRKSSGVPKTIPAQAVSTAQADPDPPDPAEDPPEDPPELAPDEEPPLLAKACQPSASLFFFVVLAGSVVAGASVVATMVVSATVVGSGVVFGASVSFGGFVFFGGSVLGGSVASAGVVGNGFGAAVAQISGSDLQNFCRHDVDHTL
mmetsp:Transcript_58365/g.137543  ORF Transcript_58365/g.137543 Transcript_58365/m.137543 type:complete len:220 (-) Transcript_58365:96-755(-)